jgi:hypothetical protein
MPLQNPLHPAFAQTKLNKQKIKNTRITTVINIGESVS